MKLNPITALFEPIEKLINEHGSAAILRDHVALFKDQLSVLKEKFAVIEAENEALKMENQKMTTENENFRKIIQDYEKSPHNKLLDEAKVNILRLLFKNDNLSIEQISQSLDFGIQTAKYHLEELKDKKMTSHHFTRGPFDIPFMSWSIEQEGRRYLIENEKTS